MEIVVDGEKIQVDAHQTCLEATLEAGIYIPHLCYHPHLVPVGGLRSMEAIYRGDSLHRGLPGLTAEGCRLCLIEIKGREGLFQSCKTPVEDGMEIVTDSEQIRVKRQEMLSVILERHPHACLLCEQAEGCNRKVCSMQVVEEERCCSKFGVCELQAVSSYIGIDRALPPFKPFDCPKTDSDPLIQRDYKLCVGCLRCIEVCKNVRGVDALGFVIEDDRVVVGSKSSTLMDSGCQFCGYCVEVCPTGALMDKTKGVGDRESYLIPCKNACPAGVDIPQYVRLTGQKKYDDALKVVMESVPLPGVLGRVCFHPCEDNCRRGSLDDAVSICALKRFIADECSDIEYSVPADNGKRVAIVGSGPAGLTAACYLRRSGYDVVIYEQFPEPGGMLRLGIPAYRLPRDVLDKEIGKIANMGIEIKTNTRVEDLDSLLSDGFDAVFTGIGAHKDLDLGIPGEDSAAVLDGVTFLRETNLGHKVGLYNKVAVVIGGGNVALDSARSALREGASHVTLFYRRTRDEMPAYEEEIEAALDEGVTIVYQVAPRSIKEKDGKLVVELIRMSLGEMDESNRPRPVQIDGSEYEVEVDSLIKAVGQASEIPEGFKINGAGNASPRKGVFVGGDQITGPKSVIEAIESGRNAAILIHEYLGGEGDIGAPMTVPAEVNLKVADETFVDKTRHVMPLLGIEDRGQTYSEVCLGYDETSVVDEAKRCLGCDLRFKISGTIKPPEKWLSLKPENIEDVPETEGVYTLFDEDGEVCRIAGTENLKQALLEELDKTNETRYFVFEEDAMFTAKERQLIQIYTKEHGRMPGGDDELDDLF